MAKLSTGSSDAIAFPERGGDGDLGRHVSQRSSKRNAPKKREVTRNVEIAPILLYYKRDSSVCLWGFIVGPDGMTP